MLFFSFDQGYQAKTTQARLSQGLRSEAEQPEGLDLDWTSGVVYSLFPDWSAENCLHKLCLFLEKVLVSAIQVAQCLLQWN